MATVSHWVEISVSQSVHLLSCVWLFSTPWTAARQASLSITNSPSLLRLMSTESVMPSNHLILCHPLLLLPSIFPSIMVYSYELVLHIRWPKYWSFNFNISLCNEYSGLISFRMDWLYLLAVQGTLKSLLQHHSSRASVLRHSAFLWWSGTEPMSSSRYAGERHMCTHAHTHTHTSVFELYISFLSGFVSFISSMVI